MAYQDTGNNNESISRRMSSIGRRPSANGPIAQSLRRATSWILGRRDSGIPNNVPSKRISDGSIPPVESNQTKKLMTVKCGGASLRGYRHKTNEDSLCIEANIVQGIQETGEESVGFAAVFDGHAGGSCSSHLQLSLTAHVKNIFSKDPSINSSDSVEWKRYAKQTLFEAFASTDKDFLALAKARGDPSGACAVACLVKGSSVVIAHVGDCAVILIEPDELGNCGHERLTRDHNARNSTEVNRVTAAGAVIINDRLQGKLQPLRAFGDIELKKAGLISTPDLLDRTLNPSSCLVLCSDGVTSKLTDKEIAEFVTNSLNQEGSDPSKVASELILHVSKDKHGLDDASAVLLLFEEAA